MEQHPILDSISGPADLKRLPEKALPVLAAEIRDYMIDTLSHTGGHLASSLGAVELIIAMHRVFDSPTDKLVFDVGHQAYAHKILTGRREAFLSLRKKDGLSGFPKRSESEHDSFNTGHATTSISAALGMARGMALTHSKGVAVALAGDGAMTGGMAYEALNDAGQADLPLIVILNDNDMSIAKNVGALRRQLNNMRINKGYIRFKRWLVRALDTGRVGKWLSRHMERFKNRIKNFLLPDLLFEEMGFIYLGPIDGHNIPELIRVLTRAKEIHAPVVVHAVTIKGRGYAFSEDDPEKFHGVAPFSIDTGAVESVVQKSNSELFGDAMLALAKGDARVAAVTAAMPLGTGLTRFAERFPERFFDVGIAEEHAVTMAAGMAAVGLRPVVAIYSTFLQRAYDQVLHDVALQRLPVVLAVDRAGLVGEDGETHQGIFDVAFLLTVPGLTIYSPASQQELVHALNTAVERGEPAAVRYNRGRLMQLASGVPMAPGVWEELLPISACTVVATGCMVASALPVCREFGAGLVNARTIRPMDEPMLDEIARRSKRVVVVEDGIVAFGDKVRARLAGLSVTTLGAPVMAVPQGSIAEQRALCGLTQADIENAVRGEACKQDAAEREEGLEEA